MVYDANVLYPSALRDLLIRVGIARIVQPKWTDAILDEVFLNLAGNRPDLDPSRLQATRGLMNVAIRDVLVKNYEHLIERIILPDINDRHVLAAAIHSGATVIVTKNLKDFHTEELSKWEIVAQHPDEFLSLIVSDNKELVLGIVDEMAAAWRSPAADARHVLGQLSADIPVAVKELLAELTCSS